MSKLYVVGIGPGAYEQMTMRAAEALNQCEVIVGYTVYIDLVEAHFPGKKFMTTPMKKEVDRCHMAFQEALKDQSVAMICSGDAGVYGMAGLILELGEQYPEVEVEVIPGVTAAMAGGALLGAPLMHDFAVISLSDLLTPWETIENRVRCAVQGDFSMCIYNPSSKKRHDYLLKICDIILEYADDSRVCGIAEKIGREGEAIRVMTLGELRNTSVDMFTTVFVGNSQTKSINGQMVTPRGYRY